MPHLEATACVSPYELLDRLETLFSARKAAYGDFAFRGQGSANWALIPKAFRAGESLSYRDPMVVATLADPVNQARAEISVLTDFLRLADTIGLELPVGSASFIDSHDREQRMETLATSGVWPPTYALEAVAVAQHHGVPTRLLDFSFEPRVAALFAALDQQSDDAMAIWAIDLRFTRLVWGLSDHANHRRIQEVTVPRGPNRYLHAQHGLFLLDLLATHEWNAGAPPSFDHVLAKTEEYWSLQKGLWQTEETKQQLLPAVLKFELPRSQAGTLIGILTARGLTQAHLQPDFSGVAHALALSRARLKG